MILAANKIEEKRMFSVVVNLTRTEKNQLRKLSKDVGMKMSPFVRECVFHRFLDKINIVVNQGIRPIGTIPRRIKKSSKIEDPIQKELENGFRNVIKELQKGFQEQREFLKPIPKKKQNKIQKQKYGQRERAKI